ncbi:MAG: biotin--[acetyl-CoA-carboxylase] ligase [Candidatus Eremiobacteraeota bacterium]|nr:biotin--[acetyl-CoA-carboxylase] ligase [Candidatus Eremiobacteraeota bacterium]
MDLRAGPYESVARELAGTAFASIAYVEETASTNADAAELLDDDRFGGHTIVAEFQRRGAGRKGRLWLAPAGTSLLFTTILPRCVDTQRLWVVPYWIALAVRDALLHFGVSTTLQWPNDLLLNERKLAGVLCQSSVIGLRARVACGVGINVKRPGADAGIEPPPVYCDDVALVDRAALLKGILLKCERTLFMLDHPPRIAAAWEAAAELPGRRYRIALDEGGAPFEATAQALGDDGGLRILREDGSSEIVSLADARVVRP